MIFVESLGFVQSSNDVELIGRERRDRIKKIRFSSFGGKFSRRGAAVFSLCDPSFRSVA